MNYIKNNKLLIYILLASLMSIFLFFLFQLLPVSIIGVEHLRGYNSSELMSGFRCSSFASAYSCSLGINIFHNLFSLFSNSKLVLILVLLFLFSYACILLSIEFYKITSNKLLSVLLLLSIFLNPKLFSPIFTVDNRYSLTITIVIFILGLILKFSYTKNLKIIALISFFIGFAIIVRNEAYSMLPLLVIILFVCWKDFSKESKIKIIIAFFLPVFMVITVEKLIYHRYNPEPLETVVGIVILGKVPLIAVKPVTNSKFPKLSNEMYNRGKEIRDIINQADKFTHRQYLRNLFNYYNQDALMIVKKTKYLIELYGEEYGNRDYVLRELFIEFAKENPLQTIKIMTLEFIGMWNVSDALSKNNLVELLSIYDNYNFKYMHNRGIIQSYRIPIVDRAYVRLANVIKGIMFVILISTIYLFIFGFKNMIISLKNKKSFGNLGFVSFIIPLMLIGYFLLLAIINHGRYGYTIQYWAVMMIILFLAIHLLLGKFKKT